MSPLLNRTKTNFVVKSDRTLYRYRTTKMLGRGGFGEVYQAHIRHLKLDVALKRFRVMPGQTEKMFDDWAREFTIHNSLSHPNILQLFDAFEDNGYVYIATELATASLDKCTPTDGWDESEVMRAGMHIASALHYMHTAWREGSRLIHRDITPNNIFYFQGLSMFKVGDFGIAKLLDSEDNIAVTQIGNWSWVAPELVRLGYTDHQSDLFQLGLVLYFMSQGRSAIEQTLSVFEKKQAIANGTAYKQANDAFFFSDELKDCIKRLLLRDISKRYQRAEEVFNDLRSAHIKAQQAG